MGKIFLTAGALEKKDNIPQVAVHVKLLRELQTEHYWETVSLKKLDEVREALLDLIKYLEKENQKPVYTNFQDDLDVSGIIMTEPVTTSYTSLQSYKDRRSF